MFTSTNLTQIQDSLPIIPGSEKIILHYTVLDSTYYSIQFEKGLIQWNITLNPTDTLWVKYWVFPVPFNKAVFHKKSIDFLQPKESLNPFAYQFYDEAKNPSWGGTTLNKSGSISRGISLGNSQDLSVASNLNLQLSGKISDEISILAAITDNNIPIQPEGNTQQLQDFDQVYVQLFNAQHRVTVGDFQLQEKQSYFMRYFKKVQGISYQGAVASNQNKGFIQTRLSGAASRGKFARQTLNQQEGNQGPYRLFGAENELFIIVLSGTERVFIDGEVLTRGQENDYVIDYNTAEITFTTKRLITKDRRIIVEFQYADRNYVRTLADFSIQYTQKNHRIYMKYYTEQDLKNQPISSDLNDEKKLFLSTVGDNLQSALYPSADTASFSNNRILYKKSDTLGYQGVFVYSTDSSTSLYQVSFSLVGSGNGDYIQAQSSANGRVFAWVAPDTINGIIIKKGDYVPLQLLITPKKRQMISFGYAYQHKNNEFFIEGASSNNDLNTFSELNNGDNRSVALKLNNVYTSDENDRGYFIKQNVQYEFINRNFKEIEWFRNAEFLRDWNLSGIILQNNQHIPQAGIGIYQKKWGKIIDYQLNTYITDHQELQAFKHDLSSVFTTNKLQVQSISSWLSSAYDTVNSSFIRNKSTIQYKLKPIFIGFKDDIEFNQYFNSNNRSHLYANSYQFIEWEVFIKEPDSAKNHFMLSYLERRDKIVSDSLLTPFTFARHYNADYDLLKEKNITIKGRSTYRNLRIVNPELNPLIRPEQTILNRIEYSFNLWKNSLQWASYYELGSGLEARRVYSYIEVLPGQGAYTWIDYNKNGIKELNEFEIAAFKDQANYIKIFTPTTDYIQTKNNQFSQSVFFRPEKYFKKKKGIVSVIRIFSNQFSYKIDWKTLNKSILENFNPFVINPQDTMLIGINKIVRNSLFLNRTDPVKGLTINYQSTANKLFSNNGFEYRDQYFWEGIGRLNIKIKYLIEIRALHGYKKSNNEFFNTRNFNVEINEYEPRIITQWNNYIRTVLSYKNTFKQNEITFGGEKSTQHTLRIENRWSIAGKTNLETQFSYILINYKLPTDENPNLNSAIAFEMLEGLQQGKNLTWNIGLMKTLKNNVQLTIQYNGRTSENSKTIHVGSAEVRAFF